jgi:hypothetical protein
VVKYLVDSLQSYETNYSDAPNRIQQIELRGRSFTFSQSQQIIEDVHSSSSSQRFNQPDSQLEDRDSSESESTAEFFFLNLLSVTENSGIARGFSENFFLFIWEAPGNFWIFFVSLPEISAVSRNLV